MQKLRPDMDIGKNIQDLRHKCGYTQEQVVAYMQLLGCNLSRVTYAKIEGNNYNIRVSELVALKIIFEADFSDFFDGLVPSDVNLSNF
ncbi:MAG: helix-turn-helix domain-containing protein [Candidatus Dehalobacter alkaniphilus]